MGMFHERDDFAQAVKSGEMVQVGTDRLGLPTYSHRNCFAKPFAGVSPDLSRVLHAIVRQKLAIRL